MKNAFPQIVPCPALGVIKSTLFRRAVVILLPLFSLTSCGTDPERDPPPEEEITTSAQTTPDEAETIDHSNTLFSQYFPESVTNRMFALKQDFDQGLRQGFGDRDLPYVYGQHARRLRMDLLESASVHGLYPFNKGFSLKDHRSVVEDIPFFTDKCGFQLDSPRVVVNYLCLNQNESYFRYLADLGEDTPLIEKFREEYQSAKTLTPGMQQIIAVDALSGLDFYDADHQLFYALYLIWVNEELLARKRVNNF